MRSRRRSRTSSTSTVSSSSSSSSHHRRAECPDFAAETAATNSLGADDALLLVAIDDRTDAIWVADGLDEITDDEIDTILADTLEPRLRDGDFAGAAIATAQALGVAAESAAPTSVPAPTAPGPTTAPGGGSS